MTDLDEDCSSNPIAGWGKYNKHLKIGGVKITARRVAQGKTAYFTTPYLTGGPGGEKNWRGEPTMPQDDLNTLVKQVYDMNVPLLVHTNGDAPIDMFLTAYEFARAGDFTRPWNVTTIHTQFMRKDHIAKFVNTRSGRRSTRCTRSTSRRPTETIAGAEQAATSARCATRLTPGCARPTTRTSTSHRSTRCS